MEWLRFLDPGWIGIVIGLASVVLALFLYRASRIGARPSYQRGGLLLIGQGNEHVLPPEVEISFGGTSVPRLTLSHVAGSELFVVYNEQRDTLTPRYLELQNRAFIIKINRLFRF